MIVLYTFDFKNGAPKDDKKHQMTMLYISIQSVLDSENTRNVRIIVYTNDGIVKKCIKNHFQGDVEVIHGNNKSDVCDGLFFSCAGHSRVPLLKQFIHEDNVLYMDNDTICHPKFINTLHRHKNPTLYMIEYADRLSTWCLRHHGNDSLYKYIREKYLIRYNKDTDPLVINNGVVYIERNSRSIDWIRNVQKIYNDLRENVGYSFGLDQTSMSLACHLGGYKDTFPYHTTCEDHVIHLYLDKPGYFERIQRSGIKLDDNYNMNYKFVMVHHKLFA